MFLRIRFVQKRNFSLFNYVIGLYDVGSGREQSVYCLLVITVKSIHKIEQKKKGERILPSYFFRSFFFFYECLARLLTFFGIVAHFVFSTFSEPSTWHKNYFQGIFIVFAVYLTRLLSHQTQKSRGCGAFFVRLVFVIGILLVLNWRFFKIEF